VAGAESNRDKAISKIIEGLEAKRRPCPERLEISGYTESAVCADVDSDVKQFRKLLRKTLRKGDPSLNALIEERKSQDGTLWAAKLLVNGAFMWDLYLETPTGLIVLASPPSCVPTTGDVPFILADERSDLDSIPLATHREPAQYPARSRTERRGGIVVLDALIGEDGSISGTCTVYASPPGYGFEEAARAAVQQWKYEPAQKDGKPVAVITRVVTTFSFSGP